MKNNRLILILASSLILFFSCQQGVIFHDIEQEIQYEPPKVQGNIYSMVPCCEKLFVQNNIIWSKAWSATRDWSPSTTPVPGKHVVRLASDASYLYALVKDNATETTGTVYVANANSETLSWTQVQNATNVKELYDNRIFNDSNGTTTGRNAYFTDNDNNVKKLAGTRAPVTQTVTDAVEATSSYIKTAASNGTTDYFSSNPAFAVAQIGSTTYFYTFNDKTIKYKEASASSWVNGGTTQAIITALTLKAPGSSELLVGTQGGFETSTINESGVPGNGVTPSENAESAFGIRYVTGIWHYGNAGTLYVAVVSLEHSKYNTLWGYYDSGNKKWNYE